MTLQEARERIGQKVTYRTPGRLPEDGVVVSVNAAFVFVRYGGDVGAKATRPGDLEPLAR